MSNFRFLFQSDEHPWNDVLRGSLIMAAVIPVAIGTIKQDTQVALGMPGPGAAGALSTVYQKQNLDPGSESPPRMRVEGMPWILDPEEGDQSSAMQRGLNALIEVSPLKRQLRAKFTDGCRKVGTPINTDSLLADARITLNGIVDEAMNDLVTCESQNSRPVSDYVHVTHYIPEPLHTLYRYAQDAEVLRERLGLWLNVSHEEWAPTMSETLQKWIQWSQAERELTPILGSDTADKIKALNKWSIQVAKNAWEKIEECRQEESVPAWMHNYKKSGLWTDSIKSLYTLPQDTHELCVKSAVDTLKMALPIENCLHVHPPLKTWTSHMISALRVFGSQEKPTYLDKEQIERLVGTWMLLMDSYMRSSKSAIKGSECSCRKACDRFFKSGKSTIEDWDEPVVVPRRVDPSKLYPKLPDPNANHPWYVG